MGLKRYFNDIDLAFSDAIKEDGEYIKARNKSFADEHIKGWCVARYNDAETLIMTAGKMCYDALGRGRQDPESYITNILENAHGSVLEHVSWNFIITGVSRVFSHEHVRHRAGVAISQRSQRYVNEAESEVIRQPLIDANPEAKALWEASVANAQQTYKSIAELLKKDVETLIPDATLRLKTIRSAARSILPSASETCLFWTANARALRHYLEMRGDAHAEVEIREVAIQIADIMKEEAPSIFKDFIVYIMPDGTKALKSTYKKV
jgi:thymidylate synthase (FAD)